MSYTYTVDVGDGVKTVFPFSFAGQDEGYLSVSNIQVFVAGTSVPFTVYRNDPNKVYLNTAPAVGAEVLIRRIMPKNIPFTDFARGNPFSQDALNDTNLQQLYVVQEILDGFLPTGFYWKQDINMGGHKITNMAPGSQNGDATNWEQLQVEVQRNDQQDLRLGHIEAAISNSGGNPADAVTFYDLAKPTATKLIGASDYITQFDYNTRIKTVSDFGGQRGFSNDSTAAIIRFIEDINKGGNGQTTYIIDGLYRVTSELPAITQPNRLQGASPALSAILFDGLDTGLKYDFRELVGTDNPASIFEGISLLTNKKANGNALELRSSVLGNTRLPRFFARNFQLDSYTRFIANAGRSNQEWKRGIKIGDMADTAGFHSVRLENFNIYGSDENDTYATLTSHNSQGVVGYNSSGIFIRGAKIYLLSDDGVLINGQCEGWIVSESEIVATRGGFHQANPVNPSNNNSIVQTHLAPFERGVKIEGAATDQATPLDNYISKLLILEREAEVVKSGGFVGIECLGKFCSITDNWVYSGAGSPNSSVGFVVGRAGNMLSNNFVRRTTHAIKVEDHQWTTTLVPLVNGLWSDSLGGRFLHPSSTINPTGLMADSSDKLGFGSINWNRPAFLCASYALVNRDTEQKMFDFSQGVMTVKSSTPLGTTQITHKNSDSDIEYGQLQFSGGISGVAQSSRATLKATSGFNVRGNTTPETANTWNCGTPTLPWAGGATQVAFTVTSDMRAKSDIRLLSEQDTLLDAWSEVDWYQYKLTDHITKLGDRAEYQFGVMAQEILAIFQSHGLDAAKYGLVVYESWDEILDAEGNVLVEAGDLYTVNYTAAHSLEAAYQRRRLARLEATLLTK